MNWDAINAISQFVSSIAVVFSVLYLAKEVHRSTRVAKVAAQDAAASALRDVTNTFMENAEMSRIWGVGLEDLTTLSPEEQARFFHAAHQFLKALETIHFHYLSGLMDEQLWATLEGLQQDLVIAVTHIDICLEKLRPLTDAGLTISANTTESPETQVWAHPPRQAQAS